MTMAVESGEVECNGGTVEAGTSKATLEGMTMVMRTKQYEGRFLIRFRTLFGIIGMDHRSAYTMVSDLDVMRSLIASQAQ